MKRKDVLVNILVLVCLLAVWQLTIYSGAFLGDLASPTDVFLVLLDADKMAKLLYLTLVTITYSLSAVIIGTVTGYLVGLLGYFSRVDVLYRLAAALKSVPVTALLPIFIVVFGYEHLILPMVSLPIFAMMCVNTWDSCRRLSGQRSNTRRMLGMGMLRYVRHVVFWETLEVILATLRAAIPYSLALVVALDYFLARPSALGHFLETARSSYDLGPLYTGIILISCAGIALVASLDAISKRLLRWKT